MKKFSVSYDEWGILVDADTVEQAKIEAFQSFQEFYPASVSEEKFMNGITNIREI